MIPEAAVEAVEHEVPLDLTKATIMAASIDDGSAGWTTPGRIPEAAVEAAAIEWVGKHNWENCKPEWKIDYSTRAHAGLMAAAPHMLAGLRDLVEDMERQPSSEIATVSGMASIIRDAAGDLL